MVQLTDKAIHDLVVHHPNPADENINNDIMVGEVFVEPHLETGLFKAKVSVNRNIKSVGYQLFLDGESNYNLMTYESSYFFSGKFNSEKSITIRLVLEQGNFITTSLKKKKRTLNTVNYFNHPINPWRTLSIAGKR